MSLPLSANGTYRVFLGPIFVYLLMIEGYLVLAIASIDRWEGGGVLYHITSAYYLYPPGSLKFGDSDVQSIDEVI